MIERNILLFMVALVLVMFALIFAMAASSNESLDCQPLGNFETRSVYTHSIMIGKVSVPQYQMRRQEQYLCRNTETGETKNIWMRPASQTKD